MQKPIKLPPLWLPRWEERSPSPRSPREDAAGGVEGVGCSSGILTHFNRDFVAQNILGFTRPCGFIFTRVLHFRPLSHA